MNQQQGKMEARKPIASTNASQKPVNHHSSDTTSQMTNDTKEDAIVARKANMDATGVCVEGLGSEGGSSARTDPFSIDPREYDPGDLMTDVRLEHLTELYMDALDLESEGDLSDEDSDRFNEAADLINQAIHLLRSIT